MEYWKAIVGYEGLYEVSDLGHVRSLDRIVDGPRQASYKIRGRAMKPYLSRGYLRLQLCKHGIVTKHQVHILVMRAFVGPVPRGKECNHKNTQRDDPRLDNLEYLEKSKNRATRFGHHNVGSEHGRHKLIESNVKEIKLMLKAHKTLSVIAGHFKVSIPTISMIRCNRTWRHVII